MKGVNRSAHEGSSKRFQRIDNSLPWDQIQMIAKEQSRACALCTAEKFGTCWVNVRSIPKNGECNITNKKFSKWKAENPGDRLRV